MTSTSRDRVHAALVLAFAAAAACAPDSVAAPHGVTVSAPTLTIASSSIFGVQLRAFPNDPIYPTDPLYGFGNLQVRLGATLNDSCFPNDPIVPAPGFTRFTLCGKIFNSGGALYKGGGIYLIDALGDSFNFLIASFNGALPPNPCHRYDVAGSAVVSDAVAADMIANPKNYAVRFDGQVGGSTTRIGGRFDGSAWGSVNSPGDPYQPSDPYFAEKVCAVAIVP